LDARTKTIRDSVAHHYNAVMGRPSAEPRFLQITLVGLLLVAIVGIAANLPLTQPGTGFAGRIERLSEPGGFFDTDNLISNENSYLDVMPALGQRGGAYIGVGPDQNFSYIAAVRPSIAFLIDIRRDNMLLHLLFKALFELSATRLEYLALLTGRPVPADLTRWRGADIGAIVDYIDQSRVDPSAAAAFRARIDQQIRKSGVKLDEDDWDTIDRFHRRFIADGLDLKFQSAGRSPRSYYPNYRQLLTSKDPAGAQRNYLASEDAFLFLKDLHTRHRIVPVVGDVSGTKAMAAIAQYLSDTGERVSTFYISNVEFYLFHGDTFGRYVGNLRRLPRVDSAVMIRSLFGPYSWGSGASSSRLQPIASVLDRFERGQIRRYADLVTHEGL
jgi:hypothetical protein